MFSSCLQPAPNLFESPSDPAVTGFNWTCLLPTPNLFESPSGLVVTGDSWMINSAAGVANATRRLQTEQPRTLDVDIHRDLPIPPELTQMLQVVQQRFTGSLKLKLWRSYFNYNDCSQMIGILENAR